MVVASYACELGGFFMTKVAAMEEMYLIYQAMRGYLAGAESQLECPLI